MQGQSFDLLKYIKYPYIDQRFCDGVQTALDAADDWILNIESVCARSEAHAISESRGDITRLGRFANNANKTLFEFIDEVDLAMFGWGTSKQREALLSGYLNKEIKFRTAEFSDNFTNSEER